MAVSLPHLGLPPTIVPLPDFDAGELAPVCEVLWQERFRVWSVSIERLDNLAELLAGFGRRAKIGVHGLTSVEQAGAAAAAGAAFVASAFLIPDLVTAVPHLPVILGGLTPTELLAGLGVGAAAVQVCPSEAFGTAMARALPSLLPHDSLIASGRMERYQAETWLGAGALAVCPSDLVSPDLVVAESLDGLRAKLQRWREGD